MKAPKITVASKHDDQSTKRKISSPQNQNFSKLQDGETNVNNSYAMLRKPNYAKSGNLGQKEANF